METLLKRLAELSLDVDRHTLWPQVQLQALADAGVLGWVIPQQFGGGEVSPLTMLQGYEDLSAACLTTAFILTQRNGACQRIAACDNAELKSRLLPDLASGKTFATVGISHLTTSRQHIHTPAVQADIERDVIRLNGSIPWVTGAVHASYIVTGGACPDGRQVLVALPTGLPGVTVRPYAELMAFTASHTASVDVENVLLPMDHVLAGPVEGVMKQGQGGGTGSLTTSVLALGLARRAGKLIRDQAKERPDLTDVAQRFTSELQALHNDLYGAAEHGDQGSPHLSAAAIRHRANSLALRITQAALGISKGAGFVKGHPAELAVREAMFFLVWSCPQPVVQGVLDELACRAGG
ncbi:acyl-CoA dehydrogenase family protein [Planctomicrobium piriforme]|uniref:Acyl-CoA dehydrogenase n=1 Tax=Planctomicrobium piriforme TaxID=1576369 RepID=A0A1I3BKK9_9PLAN|nr:acyl-CoA dehydrogenase family protein [Planctomicrobium piriforme]SFH62812.1 Acyl-CoA dehydrogenase [Planctomicrobium piriforme]